MTSREIVQTRIIVGKALRAEGLDDVKFIARTKNGTQYITAKNWPKEKLGENSPTVAERVKKAIEGSELKHGFPVVVDLRAN